MEEVQSGREVGKDKYYLARTGWSDSEFTLRIVPMYFTRFKVFVAVDMSILIFGV
jgi:hypothetical protein